jgi:DedD protein
MPFFNLRRNAKGAPPAAATAGGKPESAETIRRQAKHRLIGSSVLVLAGVIGFPLLFDTQPRPVAVDIPIEVPSKNSARPLAVAPAASPPAKNPADRVAADSSLAPREEIVAPNQAAAQANRAQAAIKNEAKPEPKTEARPEQKVAKVDPKAPAKPAVSDDSARAKALLDGGKSEASADGRTIVQVGAFADVEKARETRAKLEKAGLKTYTQVAETKDGKRIRVRVGPFANKAEAEKAASKIKSLDLPASILTL